MKRLVLLSVLAVAASLPMGTAQAQWLQNGTNEYYNGGNVGIGTSTPASVLHLKGAGGVSQVTMSTPGTQLFRFGGIPGVANWGAETLNTNFNGSGWVLDDAATNGWFFKLDGRSNGASFFNGLWLFNVPTGAGTHTNETALFGVTNGNAFFAQPVGIGISSQAAPDATLQVVGTVHVTSDVTVDGNIAAKYQDVAEWVPSSQTLEAGTVVVVDPSVSNEVVASNHAYQTSVAGVVSAQPGLILGVGGDSKAKIATTGRVRVRVDATRGAVLPGDLLVTSDESGMAMRSEAVDLGGVKIHRPGTIVGKALEPLPSGKGQILVLLSLQ